MQSAMYKTKQKGFTLIEVLLVIAILAILAAVVIVAINPSKQLMKSRDAQRSADVYSILNAVYQYTVDHESAFPEALTTDNLEICRTASVNCINLHDLTALTENQEYLVSMPIDPRCPYDGAYCSDEGTGYFLQLTNNGRVTVSAPSAEGGEPISVTR
ncbi:MAG: type II secretion system protein [Minisyncoccia bacterium]